MVMKELERVIIKKGVIQLMFKNGEGSLSVYDKDYGVERSFQLYDETGLLEILLQQGMTLVPAESPGCLGGLLYFADGKKSRSLPVLYPQGGWERCQPPSSRSW